MEILERVIKYTLTPFTNEKGTLFGPDTLWFYKLTHADDEKIIRICRVN